MLCGHVVKGEQTCISVRRLYETNDDVALDASNDSFLIIPYFLTQKVSGIKNAA